MTTRDDVREWLYGIVDRALASENFTASNPVETAECGATENNFVIRRVTGKRSLILEWEEGD